MPQLFHRRSNTLARVTIFGALFIVGVGLTILFNINRTSWVNEVGIPKEQPVPFSHEHHVSGLGIDCRYCHTSVETSNFAGIPPLNTCMTCHSQIWTNAEMLEPIRKAYKEGRSIPWVRVHDLPDFVYFDHSIHINKGVACITCHGPIGKMPLTWKQNSLNMEWCLACHRHPEKNIGPRSAVFNPEPQPVSQETRDYLVKEYKVQKLTNCSVCHR
jgi:hypothetical protein